MWNPILALSRRGRARDSPKATVNWLPLFRARADGAMRGAEAIYAAVSRISNAIASMPIHLYKGRELATDHPMERLISYVPNANHTPYSFVQTMEVLRNTEGNAYALIVEQPLGAVKRLDILDPTRVYPKRNMDTGEMWYEIMLDDGRRHVLPCCQLITLKHMSANGEVGIRPIDVLAGTMDYDKQVKEYSLKQLEGVNSGLFVNVPNTGLGRDGKDKLVADFMDVYNKSGGKIVVLEGGLTATPFSHSPVSAQVLDVERITRNRVATVYNIPPHMLGDYTDTSYSTAEQSMREFMQLTLLPIVQQWTQELNRKLLTEADYRAGYRFRFDMEALSRADTATMAEKYSKAVRGGWMRPNEVRAMEGQPPDKYGDELMASRDLLPLRIGVEHPELLLKAGGGGSERKEETD